MLENSRKTFKKKNIRLLLFDFSAIRAQLGLKPLPIEKLPPTNMKRREHNTHTAKARVSHFRTKTKREFRQFDCDCERCTNGFHFALTGQHSSKMRTDLCNGAGGGEYQVGYIRA